MFVTVSNDNCCNMNGLPGSFVVAAGTRALSNRGNAGMSGKADRCVVNAVPGHGR